ncbi:hypothetical protein CPB84DRAFT_1683426 [Gymnopilus junonius]|uniref:G domain-containing protein n=1 Tax=Gymnopilus junonius TaxID=109634 RepID=A0A9P5NLD9_GYMJU|nr:hypothetical protein CPB84DRAFT_1683426 [Gymnopilus junonius]
MYVPVSVMGPPDSGKSTFIQSLRCSSQTSPGGSLHSRNKKIEWHCIDSDRLLDHPNGRLVVAEIPSFDDTLEGDKETLRQIAAWLAHCYGMGVKFGGAIYLHDISLPRLTSSVRRNLDLFRSICGRVGLSAVVLSTTKWCCINNATGEQRERQLKDGLWKDIIASRSSVRQFDGTPESAWKILNFILDRVQNTYSAEALRIQKEVVDLNYRVQETDAGRLLHSMLVDIRTLYRGCIRSWKVQFQDNDLTGELEVFTEYEKCLTKDIKALELGFRGRLRLLMRNAVSVNYENGLLWLVADLRERPVRLKARCYGPFRNKGLRYFSQSLAVCVYICLLGYVI